MFTAFILVHRSYCWRSVPKPAVDAIHCVVFRLIVPVVTVITPQGVQVL